jgi:hypothetical protein
VDPIEKDSIQRLFVYFEEIELYFGIRTGHIESGDDPRIVRKGHDRHSVFGFDLFEKRLGGCFCTRKRLAPHRSTHIDCDHTGPTATNLGQSLDFDVLRVDNLPRVHNLEVCRVQIFYWLVESGHGADVELGNSPVIEIRWAGPYIVEKDLLDLLEGQGFSSCVRRHGSEQQSEQ